MTAVLAATVAGRIWPYLASGALALVLIFGSLWLAYDHGRDVETAKWQGLWNQRNADDAAAALKASSAARELENPARRQLTRYKPMLKNRSMKRGFMLLTLPMLLMGCAAKSPSYSPQIEPAAIPALAPAARQPKTPAICLPSCSTNLSNEIEIWQESLTLPE